MINIRSISVRTAGPLHVVLFLLPSLMLDEPTLNYIALYGQIALMIYTQGMATLYLPMQFECISDQLFPLTLDCHLRDFTAFYGGDENKLGFCVLPGSARDRHLPKPQWSSAKQQQSSRVPFARRQRPRTKREVEDCEKTERIFERLRRTADIMNRQKTRKLTSLREAR